MTDTAKKLTGLDLLRSPFDAAHISNLPKPTRRQTDEVKADFKKGIRCKLCGQWHHKDVVHLDYVGHAALTLRLLDSDPAWNWKPVATAADGSPAFDANGGMWIWLTVCGMTRLGYGDAEGKKGGNAVKEVIGDALRNAAMRFGAALDLWHKGDLHGHDDDAPNVVDAKAPPEPEPNPEPPFDTQGTRDNIKAAITKRVTGQALDDLWANQHTIAAIAKLPEPMQLELQKAFTDRMGEVS
jgi:hypothetical protein